MWRAEAEPASCFRRMYRSFQATAVCASTMNLSRKCRSAVPRVDGRATASPFDATRTGEALVRGPAAEILGIRSSRRIQKPESLSAAGRNPHIRALGLHGVIRRCPPTLAPTFASRRSCRPFANGCSTSCQCLQSSFRQLQDRRCRRGGRRTIP